MTTKELIAHLQTRDPHLTVLIAVDWKVDNMSAVFAREPIYAEFDPIKHVSTLKLTDQHGFLLLGMPV